MVKGKRAIYEHVGDHVVVAVLPFGDDFFLFEDRFLALFDGHEEVLEGLFVVGFDGDEEVGKK